MYISNGSYRPVFMQWHTITFPLLEGTPIGLGGTIQDNASAIGIVPQTITNKPDDGAGILIATGGSVKLSDIKYASLSDEAKESLDGIDFIQEDGMKWNKAPIPVASKTTRGIVKMASNVSEAAGDNPTAAEFKALLDALIAAGLMAEAEEE